MIRTVCLLLSVLLAGLLAGTTLSFWLTGNPAELSYPTFIEYFQGMVRAIATPITVVALPGLLLTAASAFLMRRDRPSVYFVFAALAFYIVASLSTRLGNIPINAEVLTWDLQSAPAGWQDVIDRWWFWHQTRFVAATIAFVLLVVAVFVRSTASNVDSRATA
jgi:uncharacterized membrane protein